jgi:hypothetical protein
MIASFVALMPTRPAQRQAPAAERLTEMLAVRRQLSAEKIAAENASRLLEDAMLQRLSRRRNGDALMAGCDGVMVVIRVAGHGFAPQAQHLRRTVWAR